jgi:hypothetical protein
MPRWSWLTAFGAIDDEKVIVGIDIIQDIHYKFFTRPRSPHGQTQRKDAPRVIESAPSPLPLRTICVFQFFGMTEILELFVQANSQSI